MAYNIFMKRGTQANYDALVQSTSTNADTLYFCTDSGNVYLGSKLLTGKVSTTKPGTGNEGILYIDSTGVPFVWTNGAYVQAMPQMVTAITAEGASETKLVSEKAVVDYVATAQSGDHAAVEDLKTRMTTAEGDIDALEGTVATKADKATTLAGYGIADAYTTTQTDTKISEAIAASQHLTKIVLGEEEELPEAATAQDNAIYLKPVASGAGNQYYEEFIVIEDKWEKIGDTAVDLSNYATQSWVTEQISTSATSTLQSAKEYADGLAGNYATAAQGAKADTALQQADITESATNGNITVKGTDVPVHGLGSAAYTESSAYEVAGAAATAESNAKAYTDAALTWGTF